MAGFSFGALGDIVRELNLASGYELAGELIKTAYTLGTQEPESKKAKSEELA